MTWGPFSATHLGSSPAKKYRETTTRKNPRVPVALGVLTLQMIKKHEKKHLL